MTTRTMRPGQLEAELQARLVAARAPLPRTQSTHSNGRLRTKTAVVGAMFALLLGAVAVVAFSDSGTVDVRVADNGECDSGVTVEGALVDYIGVDCEDLGSAGTGVFESFLRVHANGSEEGYNTDAPGGPDGFPEFDEVGGTWTHSILVSAIPVVTDPEHPGVLYWELYADINESNAASNPASLIALNDLEVYFTDDPAIFGYAGSFGGDATLQYDFEGEVLIRDVNAGSGEADLRYRIPINNVGDEIAIPEDCGYGDPDCAVYFVLYTQFGSGSGADYITDGGFEEWKVKEYPYVTVDKTADTTFTRTFAWDIDKSVVPETWDLLTGDTGTSEYTVEVTKDAGTDTDWAVSGTITIDNPGTQDAVITDVVDVISGAPTSADVDCGVTFPYTLEAGDTLECDYSADLPDGTDQTNTATVTLEEGTVFTGEADVLLGDPTTLVYDSINVDDTNGGTWLFSDDGSVSYDKTFACDADEGTHNNTATIRETGQSDSASVTVNCYALDVTKDADESLGRTWEWTIEKSADQTDLLLSDGQLFEVNYEVTVDATATDDEYGVTGSISVANPAPIDAELTDVSDIVSPAIAADVDCGVTFPYTLVAGDTLECDYSADLPDDADRTNTATATLQNYDYDSEGAGEASGTTDFTGSADVSFEGVIPDETDECIDVSDTNVGALGTVCADEVPKTFEYSLSFGAHPDADVILECGENTHPNTASFVTNDTGTTGESSWTVDATVECAVGCTLTQGYWKTHSEYGPAPYDDTWALLAAGADTEFFLSGQSWYEVFWTAPKKGNAYYILAHQYMAAVLNQLNGASSTADVDAAMAAAETFFNTYEPDDVLSKTVRQAAIANAGILGEYNEGLAEGGPEHCDEDATSGLTAAASLTLGVAVPFAIPLLAAIRRRLQI